MQNWKADKRILPRVRTKALEMKIKYFKSKMSLFVMENKCAIIPYIDENDLLVAVTKILTMIYSGIVKKIA